jgi:hypothetical protein
LPPDAPTIAAPAGHSTHDAAHRSETSRDAMLVELSDPATILAPCKVTAALCGVLLIVYGLSGVAFGGADFSTAFPDGRVTGDTWLGIAGNGWTNLLYVGAGSMLISAAPGLWGARVMSTFVGVMLLAFAAAAWIDGHDVLGVIAVNEWTVASWTAASGVLLLAAYWPRPAS